ncbi:thiopurine S-methyltransferase [Thalassotalea aquiviva]|uniref:thiopurine S-methyltransferase n=1 Tax=Thalassotalea aquiviva TaxID=3242415 RepID=UPI00352AAF8C
MDHDFWLNCWQHSRLGFHQDEFHPLLARYFPTLCKPTDTCVLVPLSGKSSDLLFFKNHLDVVANELSDIACLDFFKENQLEYSVIQEGAFKRYQSDQLSLYQGDFFSLNAQDLPNVDWIYDRAAIIALPELMRRQYVEHLKSFMLPNTRVFLLSLEFDQTQMKGPPFSVEQDEIKTLFQGFTIEKLAERDLTGKKFARIQLSVSQLKETLYLISRK